MEDSSVADETKRNLEAREAMVNNRTAELEAELAALTVTFEKTRADFFETIRRLAVAAEYRDPHTADHIDRVSRYCEIMGRAAGLPEDEVKLVLKASAMHDVGKIGISDLILLKPRPLTPEERETMELHTVIGSQILGGSESDVLKAGGQIALSHHEQWDGGGYPYGLKGEEIPLYGRICAIADVFDALTSTRPYKRAFSCDDACGILLEGRGSQFDPHLLDLFFERLDEVMAIQAQYGEPPVELWMPAA
jgi:putative two-component system response regulator